MGERYGWELLYIVVLSNQGNIELSRYNSTRPKASLPSQPVIINPADVHTKKSSYNENNDKLEMVEVPPSGTVHVSSTTDAKIEMTPRGDSQSARMFTISLSLLVFTAL